MNEDTARLALPMLQPGQAQKEMTHNEALARLDLTVQASVAGFGLDEPPTDPQRGQCWIVGTAPTGSWTGQAASLAGWTEGGWRFVAPVEGMAVWNLAAGLPVCWISGGWVQGDVIGKRLLIKGKQTVGPRQSAIAEPVGGSTIDMESRAAIREILAALAGHGLVEG